MLLALVSMPARLGYPVLGVLVAGDAMGLPLPGETALIASGVLAHRGALEIEWVILVAAVAAILGDNAGYLAGRYGARRLLSGRGPLAAHRLALLERATPFFERHGPRAVFFGRWIMGVRMVIAWTAGAGRMPWRSFLLWNALGGILWAVSVGLLAYLLGPVVESLVRTLGVVVAVLIALTLVALLIWGRRRARRRAAAGSPPLASPAPGIEADGRT